MNDAKNVSIIQTRPKYFKKEKEEEEEESYTVPQIEGLFAPSDL